MQGSTHSTSATARRAVDVPPALDRPCQDERPRLSESPTSRFSSGEIPRRSIRIAVYADLNLNIIDGSAIWLTSIVEALAGFADVSTAVYLKAPERRDLLTAALKQLPGVQLIFPTKGPHCPHGVLTIEQALDAILFDDAVQPYAAVVIRGFRLSQQAAQRSRLRGRLWTYLTDIPQSEEAMTADQAAALDQVAAASELMLCQTEEFRSWIEASSSSSFGRCMLLPPMIPTPPRRRAPAEILATTKRIVYSGKFAPLWKPLEMIDAFRRARERYPELELHVFGDKIHNPPEQPTFRDAVEQALRTTEGLIWHEGVTRAALFEQLAEMDVAWAWRSSELEDGTMELSTKVLEYGSVGLPVILARNPINEQCLGADYPLFANSPDEAFDLLLSLGTMTAEFRRAAEQAEAASRKFTFPQVRASWLAGPMRTLGERGRVARASAGLNLLVAGHDLKFLARYTDFVERASSVRLLTDQWNGHGTHDERQSQSLVEQADVIFCEWCLGNAVWYSHHKQPHQRLIIRFHLQEVSTDFPARLKLDAVERIIFVSEHLRREAMAKFGWPADKLAVVPNYVNVDDFKRPKLRGARFNLGLLGICPARKRLDLALSTLEELRRHDPRFTLFIKGALPWEYAWLWKRPAERDYYEQQFQRIHASPLLASSVVFDPLGPDVAAWFRKIGHILSPSDFESFHLAIAEGAASGALPRIMEREGAAEIFDPVWIDRTPTESAARILQLSQAEAFEEAAAFGESLVRERFTMQTVFAQLSEIVFDRADPD